MQLEKIILLETNIDHLTGEEIGQALTYLNEQKAILDCLYIPALGKKNRPTGILQAICQPEAEETAVKLIFRHTHTLGIRRQVIERYILPRKATSIEKCGEIIPAKEYELEGQSWLRPEADAIQHLARQSDLGAPALRFEKKKSQE